MKIRLGAKKYDLNHAAKEIVQKVKAAEEGARQAAAAIQADERYTDAYKAEKIREIAQQYEETIKGIQADYAPKLDTILSEFVASAEHIQPRQIDERCLQTLQMLKTAPKVTQPMIEQAAQSIGGDPLAIEILREFAADAGITYPIKLAAPPTPYLTIDKVQERANEIAYDFRHFFECYAKYDNGVPISYYENPEDALNQGMKPSYLRRIEVYGNELGNNPFSFGDEALDGQFAAECCETE